MKTGYTYIMASSKDGVLYIGVTSDLVKRVWQHKEEVIEGFTSQYKTKRLVYFERFDDISDAIEREKKLKNWKRNWKVALIEENNPEWYDLYPLLVK